MLSKRIFLCDQLILPEPSEMRRAMRGRRAILPALLLAISIVEISAVAAAQQRGGVLQLAYRDSLATMSPLKDVTISTIAPMMAMLNNLVLFDQHVPRNTLKSIVPDLAESWVWSADGRELTFRVRRGVRWHEGGDDAGGPSIGCRLAKCGCRTRSKPGRLVTSARSGISRIPPRPV